MRNAYIRILFFCVVFHQSIVSQVDYEMDYKHLTRLGEHLEVLDLYDAQEILGWGHELVIRYLPLHQRFNKLESAYSAFDMEFSSIDIKLIRLNRQIDSLLAIRNRSSEHEIIGESYYGKYTIAYNKWGKFYAINAKIPLNNRKSYRLEKTNQELKISSKYSFEDRVFPIYNLSSGKNDSELQKLYGKSASITQNLMTLIRNTIQKLAPLVAIASRETLDSILSTKTQHFEQNLRLRNFKSAETVLLNLQGYFNKLPDEYWKFEVLSNKLYDHQYDFIEELISKNDFKSAATNIELFREINWNKIDIEFRVDRLDAMLVEARADRHFQANEYFDAYQDYLTIIKKKSIERVNGKFANAFIAYYDSTLDECFKSQNVKVINSLFDSLNHYCNTYLHIKALGIYNREKLNQLKMFLALVTKADQSLINYVLIPGGEHYLVSKFNESIMQPFLLLKTADIKEFADLIDKCAINEGVTPVNFLSSIGLAGISKIQRLYINAGGWMTMEERQKYKRSFFAVPELTEELNYFVRPLHELQDPTLVAGLINKSEIDREGINKSIIKIRKDYGFKSFSRVRTGYSFGPGLAVLTNASSFNPNLFLKSVEMGSVQLGFSLGFPLKSLELYPIPEGGDQPAISYLEASVAYAFGLQLKKTGPEVKQDTNQIPNNLDYSVKNAMQRFDLGLGIHHYRDTEGARNQFSYYRFRLGMSFSQLSKLDEPGFTSAFKATPFLALAMSVVELYISYDPEAKKIHQLGLSLSINKIY